jgi:hypothetical protein
MMTHESLSRLVEMGTCYPDSSIEAHVIWGRSLRDEKTLRGQACEGLELVNEVCLIGEATWHRQVGPVDSTT